MSPEAGEAAKRPLLRPLLLGVAAALLYGAWALYANGGAGSGAAVRAALTQAGFSFVATFVLAVVLERLFRAGATPSRGFWLASVGTSTLGAGAVAVTHAISGTPRILVTIAPSVAVGTLVYTAYAWGLRVAAQRGRRG